MPPAAASYSVAYTTHRDSKTKVFREASFTCSPRTNPTTVLIRVRSQPDKDEAP